MDIIHLLPDSVANQIAAGEVVQRPASVIKELMENAVDAGASTVDVLVVDAGRTSIQVIDDGKGMSEQDARMAFERHATSKIRQAEDLYSLHTMGFRGEALPSIAAVAQVHLQTRTIDNELGTDLTIEGMSRRTQPDIRDPLPVCGIMDGFMARKGKVRYLVMAVPFPCQGIAKKVVLGAAVFVGGFTIKPLGGHFTQGASLVYPQLVARDMLRTE